MNSHTRFAYYSLAWPEEKTHTATQNRGRSLTHLPQPALNNFFQGR